MQLTGGVYLVFVPMATLSWLLLTSLDLSWSLLGLDTLPGNCARNPRQLVLLASLCPVRVRLSV